MLSLVLVLLGVTLVHYAVASDDYFSIDDFLENPAPYQGLYKNVMGPYGGSFDNGFYVIVNHKPVKVHYDQDYTPVRYGEVLVYGIVQEDGSVRAVGVHNYNYGYFVLYVGSIIAGIIILIIFFTEWKITRRGFERA